MNTSIMWYTDVHLRDGNPPSRKGSYTDDVFEKLHFVMDQAQQGKCSATVCGGDLYQNKKPHQNSYALTNRVLGLFRKWGGMEHLILPGNHDLTADDHGSLPSQPIGNLFVSGAVKRLGVAPHRIELHGGPTVSIHGLEFSESPNFESMRLSEEERKRQADGEYQVLVLHQYFSLSGGSIFGKSAVYSYESLLDLGYDVYLFGHYHIDQGVETLVGPGGRPATFVNIGSLTRGDYGDENLTRIPRCCRIEFSKKGVKATPIEVPCRKGSEVFDVEFKEMEKKHNKNVEEFVEALQTSTLMRGDNVADSGEGLEAEMRAVEKEEIFGESVVKLVRGFLQEAAEALKVVTR